MLPSLFVFLMTMNPAASSMVVVEPVANLYSKPDAESDVVTQALYGTAVTVLERQQDWAQVRMPDDYLGWIPAAAMRAQGATPYASAGRVLEVRSLFANLYKVPDVTKHRPLLTVPFETRLEVLVEPEEQNRRWIQVRLPDERTAWIQRGDIHFPERLMTIDEVIELSKQFLGLPYFWGGTSSFGFDCSGFTQMLCRRRGVIIPRDSGPQARWDGMQPVEVGNLQPGDLLYFGESLKRVTHTGLYIGAGEFIHATVHLRPIVQISRLDEPHWTKLLVACRRLQ